MSLRGGKELDSGRCPDSLGDVQMGNNWKYYLKVSLTIMYIILDVLL